MRENKSFFLLSANQKKESKNALMSKHTAKMLIITIGCIIADEQVFGKLNG